MCGAIQSKCVGLGGMTGKLEQAAVRDCHTLMKDHLIWARRPSQRISVFASMDIGVARKFRFPLKMSHD